MMFDIKRLLSYTYPNAVVEVSTADDTIHQNVQLSFENSKDIDYVTSIMEGAGYTLTNNLSEFASSNILTFSNESPYLELSTMEDIDESEVEDFENNRQNADIARNNSSDNAPIDGDGRAFRVLTNPEMHKFAMKVYTGMLGNTENMANYGIFAYDLDNFLSMHRNTDPSFDEEETEEDEGGTPSIPESATSMLAYMTVEEASSVLFQSDANTFYNHFSRHLPETANHKFIIKVILGIILKIISGALGKTLLNAWERRNKGLFERILYSIVKIILNDWFPSDEYDYSSEVRKYNKYAFDEEYKYDIDLDSDEWMRETSSVNDEAVEEAMRPATAGILRLLVAVIIKIMVGTTARMLTDAWIKRDKRSFEKALMYVFLQVVKYVPFRESASEQLIDEESIEVFADGSTFIHQVSLNPDEETTEIARKKKEKSGRGALLSALMRALSGDRGDRAVRAWDSGDFDAMGEILGQVAEKVMESMPYDESKDQEDTTEEPTDTSENEASESTSSESVEDIA